MTHLFIAAACSPVAKKSVAKAISSGGSVRMVVALSYKFTGAARLALPKREGLTRRPVQRQVRRRGWSYGVVLLICCTCYVNSGLGGLEGLCNTVDTLSWLMRIPGDE